MIPRVVPLHRFVAQRIPVNLFGYWTLLRIVNDKTRSTAACTGAKQVPVQGTHPA